MCSCGERGVKKECNHEYMPKEITTFTSINTIAADQNNSSTLSSSSPHI